MRKLILVVFYSCIFGGNIFAQSTNDLLRRGNDAYQEKKFSDAEVKYKKALEKNPKTEIGKFNLGDALYQQQRYEDASQQFESMAASTKDKSAQAKAFHNLGNSYVQAKKYQEGINAYKNSLKLNPKDEDTKYNLAYALSMMKQQQEQQKQNQDKNKDQKDKQQQQKKDQQQKQNEQKKEEQKPEKEQQKQQQQKEQKLSKEEAERLLEALKNEEKKVQEKLDKKKEKGTRVRVEKDW